MGDHREASDTPELGQDVPPSQARSADVARNHDLLGIGSWRRNRREADPLRKDTSVVHLADGPKFRFPVFDATTGQAVMWAVDEDANDPMMFREVSATPELAGKGSRTTTEVAVHPHWPLTDELLLMIVVAFPFLDDFFNMGGGGAG
jgi:hypothetical protein